MHCTSYQINDICFFSSYEDTNQFLLQERLESLIFYSSVIYLTSWLQEKWKWERNSSEIYSCQLKRKIVLLPKKPQHVHTQNKPQRHTQRRSSVVELHKLKRQTKLISNHSSFFHPIHPTCFWFVAPVFLTLFNALVSTNSSNVERERERERDIDIKEVP